MFWFREGKIIFNYAFLSRNLLKMPKLIAGDVNLPHVLLNPYLSFFENNVDPDQLALETINTVFPL